MKKGYDSLNDTFNTDDSVEVDAIVKAEEETKPNDVNKDYDYTCLLYTSTLPPILRV